MQEKLFDKGDGFSHLKIMFFFQPILINSRQQHIADITQDHLVACTCHYMHTIYGQRIMEILNIISHTTGD